MSTISVKVDFGIRQGPITFINKGNTIVISKITGYNKTKRGWNKFQRDDLRHSPHSYSTIDEWDFSTLQRGDIIEEAERIYFHNRYGGRWRRTIRYNCVYYRVEHTNAGEVRLKEITSTAVLKLFKKKQAIPTVKTPKRELTSYYNQFIKAKDIDTRCQALVKCVAWHHRAVQVTMSQGRLPKGSKRLWRKVKLLRERAAHDATVPQEKETCLIAALRITSKMIKSDLLPQMTFEQVVEQQRTRQPPQINSKNVLMPIAEEVAKLSNDIWLKPGYNRVSIFHNQYEGGKQNFITLTGSLSTMRVFSPFLSPNLATDTDSKGFRFKLFKQEDAAAITAFCGLLLTNFLQGKDPWN